MTDLYTKLHEYINDPENIFKIESYNKVIQIAQITLTKPMLDKEQYIQLYKLGKPVIDAGEQVMLYVRDIVEASLNLYANEHNLTEYKGFGGSDSTLDLIYFITWQGLDEVTKVVKNPVLAFERYENEEYDETYWCIFWDMITMEIESEDV